MAAFPTEINQAQSHQAPPGGAALSGPGSMQPFQSIDATQSAGQGNNRYGSNPEAAAQDNAGRVPGAPIHYVGGGSGESTGGSARHFWDMYNGILHQTSNFRSMLLYCYIWINQYKVILNIKMKHV